MARDLKEDAIDVGKGYLGSKIALKETERELADLKNQLRQQEENTKELLSQKEQHQEEMRQLMEKQRIAQLLSSKEGRKSLIYEYNKVLNEVERKVKEIENLTPEKSVMRLITGLCSEENTTEFIELLKTIDEFKQKKEIQNVLNKNINLIKGILINDEIQKRIFQKNIIDNEVGEKVFENFLKKVGKYLSKDNLKRIDPFTKELHNVLEELRLKEEYLKKIQELDKADFRILLNKLYIKQDGKNIFDEQLFKSWVNKNKLTKKDLEKIVPEKSFFEINKFMLIIFVAPLIILMGFWIRWIITSIGYDITQKSVSTIVLLIIFILPWLIVLPKKYKRYSHLREDILKKSKENLKEIKDFKEQAPKLQEQLSTIQLKWSSTLIISIFFGGLGVDRFMMRQIGWGILKLITLGGLGCWCIIDIILIATKYNFKGIKWI